MVTLVPSERQNRDGSRARMPSRALLKKAADKDDCADMALAMCCRSADGASRVYEFTTYVAAASATITSFTLPASCFRLKGLGRKWMSLSVSSRFLQASSA